ncbi:hypothetical protein [Streptomyces sp. NPDC088246]|uniref:hypothetical protein n=1 Tax=Streptomyces sp. NPDC088246 TaxID=3365842 RepID=UPI003824456F
MTDPVTCWPAGGDRVRFRLADPLRHPEFAWPRTLLHHPVRWATPSVRAEQLRLVDETGRPVAFQLSRVNSGGSQLAFAVVCFFADLPSGATREFTLCADPSVPTAHVPRPVRITEDGTSTVVDSGALRIRLPSSGRFAADAVPGPVLQLDRGHGWVGRSALRCGTERLEHLEVRLVEAGPLFATHQLRYHFTGGASYTATVGCFQGCDFVDVTEESDEFAHRLDSRPGAPDPWRVTMRSAGDLGTNPRLRSSKYTGYGVTLGADVDRPGEVAAFLQQVDRGPNYRWGIADDNGSGHIYYYAAGHSYSGQGPEDAGDRRAPDATFATSCAVWRNGAYRSIGQNTLDRPLHDLGGAQYAEIVSDPDGPVGGLYLSRSVLLVGSDYLVTYDAFAAGQRMVWTWSVLTEATGHDANSFPHLAERMPFIHVVRGVRTDGVLDGAFVTDVSWGVRLEGRADGANGNTLAVVSHRDDLEVAPARSTPWGARIRTPHSLDFVFRNEASAHYEPKTVEFADQGLRFSGTAGTIRLFDDGLRQLTLFHGSAVGTSDLLLTTGDDDLGISLRYRDPTEAQGVYHAPSDSSVSLYVPGGRHAAARFHIDGERVRPLAVSPDTITVALPRGRHHWELTGGQPQPPPSQVLRTETVGDGALVHFSTAAAADRYIVQLSSDGGHTWMTAAETERSPVHLTGLAEDEKRHVRVIARNSRRQATPGSDYPVHPTRRAPDPPDGLRLRLGHGTVTVTWGEVLGAGRYRLYRRRKGEVIHLEIYGGFGFRHVDHAPGVIPGHDDPGRARPAGVTVYEYAVAAENGNGVGPKSAAVETDPGSWRHWSPPTDLAFRRRHTYNQPPYVPASATPRPYGHQVPAPELPAVAHPAGEAP